MKNCNNCKHGNRVVYEEPCSLCTLRPGTKPQNFWKQEMIPCPFCGSTDIDFLVGYVHCKGCKSDGPHVSSASADDAVKAWNRRVTCE